MNSFAPEKLIHGKQKIETFVFFGSSYDKREFIILIRYLCINMESLLIAITSKINRYLYICCSYMKVFEGRCLSIFVHFICDLLNPVMRNIFSDTRKIHYF